MKPYMLLILFPLFLMANDKKLSNFKMGAVNTKDQSKNIYFGADWMFPSKAFSLGVGFDIVGLDSGREDTNTYGNYTLGGQIKLAYSFQSLIDFPVVIKTDLGYGVTQFYKENYYGYQYGINLETKLYKALGAGIGYKKIDTGTELGITDNYLFYLSMFF